MLETTQTPIVAVTITTWKFSTWHSRNVCYNFTKIFSYTCIQFIYVWIFILLSSELNSQQRSCRTNFCFELTSSTINSCRWQTRLIIIFEMYNNFFFVMNNNWIIIDNELFIFKTVQIKFWNTIRKYEDI